jgi:hypothetical protein
MAYRSLRAESLTPVDWIRLRRCFIDPIELGELTWVASVRSAAGELPRAEQVLVQLDELLKHPKPPEDSGRDEITGLRSRKNSGYCR